MQRRPPKLVNGCWVSLVLQQKLHMTWVVALDSPVQRREGLAVSRIDQCSAWLHDNGGSKLPVILLECVRQQMLQAVWTLELCRPVQNRASVVIAKAHIRPVRHQ